MKLCWKIFRFWGFSEITCTQIKKLKYTGLLLLKQVWSNIAASYWILPRIFLLPYLTTGCPFGVHRQKFDHFENRFFKFRTSKNLMLKLTRILYRIAFEISRNI